MEKAVDLTLINGKVMTLTGPIANDLFTYFSKKTGPSDQFGWITVRNPDGSLTSINREHIVRIDIRGGDENSEAKSAD